MTYQVTGMTCEHCVRAVTDEIESLDGVGAVTVALVPGGESAVTVSSDGPLATEVVAAALDEAGAYRLASLGGTTGTVIAPASTLPLV
ncbi:MAG: heavy-metal-associated domain-containing protein [Trebonia sp.]